jgi:cold shock CspA family protein
MMKNRRRKLDDDDGDGHAWTGVDARQGGSTGSTPVDPPPSPADHRYPTMTGRVVKHLIDKGFGFIAGDNGQEYFYHKSVCPSVFDGLVINDLVVFTYHNSPKGLRCVSVKKASQAEDLA